jgi:hypothetical protein
MPDQHKRLAKIIMQARDAHSAHTDLASAFDMITAMPEASHAAEGGVKWANHAVPALMASAILLYARATNSSSKHRATLDLHSDFSNEEKNEHDWICNLRNDALAHYGPGENFNGAAWHQEMVMLPLDRPNDARILMASRRVAASPEVVSRVKKQVHRALILAQRVIQRRDEALVDEANKAMTSDEEFAVFLKRFVIDMEEVFEGHPITEIAINGPRLGPSTEIIWAPVEASSET